MRSTVKSVFLLACLLEALPYMAKNLFKCKQTLHQVHVVLATLHQTHGVLTITCRGSGFSGMEWWTGMLEWNGGLECWNGMVEWNGGMEWWNSLSDIPNRFPAQSESLSQIVSTVH